MKRATLMEGNRFGALTVLHRKGSTKQAGVKKYATWVCLCDCGKKIVTTGYYLRYGIRTSCGCRKHLPSLTVRYKPEYNSFQSMRGRCSNPDNISYPYYGAKGVKVCARWAKFKNFMEDMGPKPTPKHQLDRKDGKGNYEPSNCRWATREEQMRNRSDNVYVVVNGERLKMVDVILQAGLTHKLVAYRLYMGWTPERAIGTPNRPRKKSKPKELDVAPKTT